MTPCMLIGCADPYCPGNAALRPWTTLEVDEHAAALLGADTGTSHPEGGER
jgi:hypothetical protein